MAHTFAAIGRTLDVENETNHYEFLTRGMMKCFYFAPIGDVPFGAEAQVAIAHPGKSRGRVQAGGLVHSHSQRGGYLLLAGQIARLDPVSTRHAA